MRIFFLILIVSIGFNSFSQPWMHSPYLTKPVENANYYDIVDAFEMWWGNRDYEKGSGYKPFKRWEYLNSYRCSPSGEFPEPGSYFKASQYVINEYNRNKHLLEKTDLSNWVPLGLTSWVNGDNGYNPGNGRVNAITVDYTNPQVIYIATPSGGIWKTLNGGQNWNTTFDQMPHLGVSAIAIHPDSNHIILAGTGDRDGYDTKATGIYRSIDYGNTWIPSGLNTTNWNSINKIIYNPANPNTVLAATNNGIFRSGDGGFTWVSVFSPGRVMNLLYHPTDTNIIYGSGKFFVISTDGGFQFIKSLSLPADTTRLEIAVTPANPDYIYVLATNSQSSYGGTYRSTNAGTSFVKMSDAPNYLGYSMDADDNSGQGWFDLAIAVSPHNANEVYIGGINVWKSTNGGISYDIMSHWIYNDPLFYTHADIHYLGFYGNRLYCGSDGGIFYSDDYGANWVDISEGLGISQVYKLASSKADPYFIVCGTQDNGTNRLQDGHWTHIFGADGMQPMTHHTDLNTFYFSYQNGGLMKTTDNGASVSGIKPDGATGSWVTPYDMHPFDSNIIYGGFSDIYVSYDAGWTWDNLTWGDFGSQPFHHLKVSPANPDYIYASRGAYMYVSKDNGLSWTVRYCGAGGSVAGIAPSYNDPEKLWVAVSGTNGDRVFLSTDAYQTQTSITGSLNGTGIRSIVHQKNSHDALFVGTENAVFYKDTLMTAWIPYMNGLPNVIISDLEINYANNMLRAATYGRGIWETQIPVTQQIDEHIRFNALNLYPNPTEGLINADISGIGTVKNIFIYNITGQIIMEIPPSGSGLIRVDMSSQVSGIYFLKVIIENKQYIQRFVLHNR